MTLFPSDREHRLWFWATAILVAIYSTLGPAAAVVGVLREHNLLRATVTLGLVSTALAVALPWLKGRPGWRELSVALGRTAQPRPQSKPPPGEQRRDGGMLVAPTAPALTGVTTWHS